MSLRSAHGFVTLVALVALSGCAAPVALDRDPRNVVVVVGRGSVSARPDIAIAQVGAEARAPQLAEATADVNRRMTEVLARVKGLGVDDRDITTIRYVIDPIPSSRRGDEDPVRIAAYRVVNVVQLRIRDLTAAGGILDAAVAAGANTLPSVSLTLSDRALKEAQARALAVQDAATQARQVADAAGVKLRELVWLQEGTSPRPIAPRGAMALAAISVEAGEMEVVVTVEAHYRIEP
jgi:uncharacterized protein YggE